MQKFIGWALTIVARLRAALRKESAVDSNGLITKRYVRAGCRFAGRISEISIYAQIEIKATLLAWEAAEEEFTQRGFRSLPLSDFIDYVLWDVPLPNVGVRREKDEEPMHHARYYWHFLRGQKGVKSLHTLLADEGLIDYDPQRRIKRFDA